MGKYRPAAGGSSGGPAAVGSRAAALEGPRSAAAPPGGAPGQDEVLRRVSAAVLAVTRELSVGDVLEVIVRSVRSLAGARYAALGVPDDRGSFAEFVVDGISERWRKAIGPLPRQHGMLGVVLHEGQPLRLADIRDDPRFEGGWPPAHPDLIDILGMPIKDGDRVLGFIFAANKVSGDGFTARDEEVLALFAAHAAIALINARLYEQARQLSVLEERARLARDLHDAVSQKLFSIRVKARAASVLAGQRAERLAPPLRDAVHHELCERAAVVGHAQRRVPGPGQGTDRAHDHLEHVTDGQLPGDRQHRRADPAKDLVLARRSSRLGISAHSGHGTFLAHTPTLPARSARRIGHRSYDKRPRTGGPHGRCRSLETRLTSIA